MEAYYYENDSRKLCDATFHPPKDAHNLDEDCEETDTLYKTKYLTTN